MKRLRARTLLFFIFVYAIQSMGCGNHLHSTDQGYTKEEAEQVDKEPSSLFDAFSKDGQALLPSGRYVIRLANKLRGNTVAIDVAKKQLDVGSILQVYPEHRQMNQQWYVQSNAAGQYTLRAAHSGMMMDVAYVSKEQGVHIHQWSSHGGANQKWYIEKKEQENYVVRSAHSNLCLTAQTTVNDIAAPLQQQPCQNKANQLFRFARTDSVTTQQKRTYRNPVITRNFPDPGVFRASNGNYYAFGTNDYQHVLAARSSNLHHWEPLPDAMPKLPPWITKVGAKHIWAPEVIEINPNRYVMYVAAVLEGDFRHCIFTAVASAPEGAYTPNSSQPLFCQMEESGVIDPSPFRDVDGQLYLLWKNDGNCCGQDTWLQLQSLSSDGLQLSGSIQRLLKQDQQWEGHVIEAPFLLYHQQRYYLFYSGNNYGNNNYGVNYAVAKNLRGPYQKNPRQWLQTSFTQGSVLGPGGQCIVQSPTGDWWLAYHSWSPHARIRPMSIAPIIWQKEGPIVSASWEQSVASSTLY